MSDDLPDPGAGDEPARDTTRTDDGRERAVETDSTDAGTVADADAGGPDETGDPDGSTGDAGAVGDAGETDGDTANADAAGGTDGDAEETGGGDEGEEEDSVPAETDVVDAAWRAALETGALVGGTDAGTGTERRRRTATRVPTGRLFELLASPGNRFVLTYLLRVDDRAEYAELVEYVVAQTDPPGGLTKATFRGRVAARLVTESLPALADAGLVEVDSDDQVVAATAATRVAAPYLALALSDMVGPVEPE